MLKGIEAEIKHPGYSEIEIGRLLKANVLTSCFIAVSSTIVIVHQGYLNS